MNVRILPRLSILLLLLAGITLTVGVQAGNPAPAAAQSVSGTVSVCGTVTTYTAASGLVPGVIAIGGVPYPIAAGTTLSGAALATVGANVCLQATLNAAGQISNGSITVNASAPLSVCGTVTAYTAATANAPGSITIGGTTYPIAAGAVLSGAGIIATNPNVCVQGNLNALGQIANGTVTANAGGSTSVNVCGTVTAYTAATATSNGSITIGGQTFPIAAGTTLNGAGLATAGANLCLQGTLNAAGQLQNGTLTANAGATVNVCGVVTAYQAATASAPGSITIAGRTIPIAMGTTLSGANLITAGANLCLSGTTNAAGQISSGGVTANAGAGVNVCGVVTAYTPATANVAGSITIGGQTIPIAAGTTLSGANLITSGANLCLSGTTNAVGQITSGGVTANATTTVNVCGVVTAYQAATANAPGSITIGGRTIPIAAGTALSGSNLITSGANLCLTGTANASGQITSGGVTANAGATVNVCGVVSAYQAATANAPGSITINGTTYAIAAGTALSGANLITSGANLCLSGTLNGSGQISSGGVTANASATATVNVCGTVSAYTAATGSAPGSITIGGQTFPIAAGTTLNGAALITTGANLCLQGTVNASGQITNGTVTATAGATVNVCGVVSNYVAATSSTPGSITIGGQTFPIAAGTTLNGAGSIADGVSLCLQASVNGSGQISSGGVSVSAGLQLNVCGLVSAYTAATPSSNGSLTIAGITFPVAAGATFSGAGTVAAGSTLGITLNLNATGLVISGTVTATSCSSTVVTGPITASTLPTATTGGSITVDGITYTIASGTTITIMPATPLAAHVLSSRGFGLRAGREIAL